MKTPKYLVKLLAFFMVIIITYSLVATLFFYFSNDKRIKTEVEANHNYLLRQTQEKIDGKLITANNIIKNLRTDTEIQYFVRNTLPNYYNITKIYKNLENSKNAFSNLEFTIAIMNEKDDTIISPTATYRSQEYFELFGFEALTRDKIFEYFSKPASKEIILKSVAPGATSQDNTFITIISKESLDLDNHFYVFFSFKENGFFSGSDQNTSGAFAIIYNSEIVSLKSSSDEAAIRNEISSRNIFNRIKASTLDAQMISENGYNYYFIYSKVMDWYYLYITPANGFNLHLTRYIIFSFLLCLMLMVIGSVLAYFSARRMYRPIKNTMQIFSHFSSDSSNLYDEFEFIGETAKKISKTNQNLEKIINDTKKPLKEKFLKDILLNLVSDKKMQEGIKQFHLEFLNKPLLIAVAEYTNYEELSKTFSTEDLYAIQSQVELIVSEYLSAKYDYEIVGIDYKRFALYITETAVDKLQNLLSTIFLNIERNFNIDLVAAIGTPCSHSTECHNSYGSCLMLLDSAVNLSDFTVVTLNSFETNSNFGYYYPIDLEREIITNVVRGKREETHELLSRIYTENFTKRNINREAINVLLLNIVGTINRIIQMSGKEDNHLFFEEGTVIFLELKMYSNIDDLTKKIEDVYDRIINVLTMNKDKRDTVLAEKMSAFIAENHHKDISLLDLAVEFNLSHSNVSAIFKKFIGQNFKDYLNEYRINIAISILKKHKNIQINQLAQQVGYNSSNTFIRIFNRYIGMSPGQYIKQL